MTVAVSPVVDEPPPQVIARSWAVRARWLDRFGPYLVAVVAWAALEPISLVRIGGRVHAVLIDDAAISMSFARTVARTGELVWYPGAPRVEGFSNPLWTAAMYVLQKIGVPDRLVGAGIQLLGLACVLVTVASVGALARRLMPDSPAVLRLSRWSVALFVPLTFWAVAGLEVTACAAVLSTLAVLVFDASAKHDHPARRWGLVAALLVVGSALRYDLVALAAPLVLSGLVVIGPRRWRHAVGLVAVPLAVIVQELVRHHYFGQWLPNTYRLKGTGADVPEQMGSGVVIAIATMTGVLLPVSVGVISGWARRDRSRRVADALVWGCAATWIATVAYVIWIGGDYMDPGQGSALGSPNRFFSAAVPVVVPLVALAGVRFWDWIRSGPRWRAPVGVLATGAAMIISAGLGWTLWLGFWGTTAAVSPALATRVMGHLTVIATAGAVVVATASLSRRRWPAALLAVVALLMWTNFDVVDRNVIDHGYQVQLDRARTGEALAATTAPTTRIAVAAAGLMVYFSNRPAIDELGKIDAVIAAGPVLQHPFIAGHSKWDSQRSLLDLHPDVIMDEWGATPQIEAELTTRGYRPLGVVAGHRGGVGPLISPTAKVNAPKLCRLLARTYYHC